ncbi:uncharacterized protein LOC143292655 [Babylonia areolata]|uniref:uncharacterized protein LOC143292655 n=1 Tax=Babylonia areolata TaxID=304850 RepID=UPI003FD323A4
MGKARGDGYRVDNPRPPSSSSSISSSSPQLNGCNMVVQATRGAPGSKPTPPQPAPQSAGRTSVGTRRPAGARNHRFKHRRHRDRGCRNPQVRKGIGSCVFVLGIPCLIAGLILTIVSSTSDGGDSRKYPSSFPVLGPILLALSVICFITGVLLYSEELRRSLRDCLGLSDKDSFCRRRFPRLAAWLKPDPNAARNQTAINNLQTNPTRSALRKIPNPDLVAMETELKDGEGYPLHRDLGSDDHNHHHQQHHHHVPPPPARRKRAVTFSQGDDSQEGGFVGVRLNSVGSEADRHSVQSENGAGSSVNGHSPSSSLLSLRHCRIRPKDEVFWTESSAGGRESVGGGGGESVDEGRKGEMGESGGGGHPDVRHGELTESGGGGGVGDGGGGDGGVGGGGVRGGRVSLTNIDEEGV